MRRLIRFSIWIVSAVCLFFGMSTSPATAATAARANGLIYFRDNNPSTGLPGIFSMKHDGTSQALVSPNLENNQFDRVSISPDGTKIAFQQLDTLGGGTGSIVVANADGSNMQTIVPVTPDIDVLFPVWSPDGTQVAYIVYDINTATVVMHTIHADGTNDQAVPIPMSDNPSVGSLAPVVWSVNNVIAYIDTDDIYTANLDGTDITNRTTEAGWTDAYPSSVAWSPDGTKLAFTAALCPGVLDSEGGSLGCLATMNADGSNKQVVVEAFRPEPSCSINPIEVSWSPDGKQLVYSKSRSCVT